MPKVGLYKPGLETSRCLIILEEARDTELNQDPFTQIIDLMISSNYFSW